MFRKLRNRIILTTMAIATVVLFMSGAIIMLSASTMRPEPMPHPEPNYSNSTPTHHDDEELKDFIKSDREEGNLRLLITLLCVGAVIEIVVFLIVFYLSQKIVEPVKDSYEKQKVFIANASHELKTPLAVIQANIEALEVDKENEKWKQNIENEVGHANKLVLDLLQLARMDTGSIKRNPSEKVDLEAEIKKRIELFEPKFGGTIRFSAKETHKMLLPKQDVLQVLDILLDNATKYGDKKISIVVNGGNVSISNDGATIAKENLEKVFDRFYQTDKTKDGSGLGLAIAKTICEQNGWSINCKSNKNATTFSVALS
ncbi:HAMP domain-containing histidine kinase [Candidatus Saccharibacteria bacterium]|nr:HAMP domain-containing histidine kinase [Candidatus Saccharibacteria bacterium]